MIRGIGVDLALVGRVREEVLEGGEDILSRFLTPAEIAYCRTKHDPFPHYTARFAAKEALVKALGTGLRDGLAWTQMEVSVDGAGRPTVALSGRAAEMARDREVSRVHVSFSHEREHAVALVVLEG
jgi:holo-[acyl-carrier protein] synthase